MSWNSAMQRSKGQRTRRGSVLRVPALALGLVLGAAAVAAAHDMFLKPSRFFAPENAEVRIRVLNGTFTRSENSIARNRLADVSVVSPYGARHSIPPSGRLRGIPAPSIYTPAGRAPTSWAYPRDRAS